MQETCAPQFSQEDPLFILFLIYNLTYSISSSIGGLRSFERSFLEIIIKMISKDTNFLLKYFNVPPQLKKKKKMLKHLQN